MKIRTMIISKIVCTLSTLLLVLIAEASEPIEVADQTFKVGALEEVNYFFGFAAGDEVIFRFEELKGKDLKEVEILEANGNSRYLEFKVSEINEKRLKIQENGVFEFRFYNGSVSGRICKVHIERIPESDATIAFNTNWEWKTFYDTTYVPYTMDSIVGYDTIRTPILVKKLQSDNLELVKVLDNHGIEVHSKEYNWSLSYDHYGKYNEEIVQVTLPEVSKSDYEVVENVVWYYSIGVNQQMKMHADQQRADLLALGSTVASFLVSPLAEVGFDLIGSVTGDGSDHSMYCAVIPNREQALAFKDDQAYTIYREDNIVNSTAIRMESPLKGTVYIGLENPEETQGATVYVSVYAWRRTRIYEDVEEVEEDIRPRLVQLNKQRMEVKTREIRVNKI